jgi:hypothetical protein
MERPPVREDFRPLMLAVDSLGELVGRLVEGEIEFVHQRGLALGQESVLVSDPAGNPVEVMEYRIAI